jgi:CHAD domain-containing protein
MRERELKLALPGRFALPTLYIDEIPLAVETLAPLTLRATYYDTADLRLARHGVSLRYRTGEDSGPTWTVKVPASGSNGTALVRDELHFDGTRRDPPPDARAMVTAFARSEPLVAVATLRTERRRFRLLFGDVPIAEIDVDEVSVFEGRRVVSRFQELEVEALDDTLDLDVLGQQLHRAGATDAEPIPKVVRALGSRATAPPDVAPPDLPSDPTMADALAASLADALGRLVRHDPSARLGDAEAIHQVRVALRRLRSDLGTLGDAVDRDWRARVEPMLRSVAAGLAAARDLDVLAASLRTDAAGSADDLAPLFAALDLRRARAAEAVATSLTDAAYPTLLDTLVAAVASPPTGPTAGVAVGEGMPKAVRAAWATLRKRAETLGPDAPDAAYHRTRIAAKRARYAAELAARVLPPKPGAKADRFARQLATLQGHLGDLQDAVVAEAAVREILTQPGVSPTLAFEAGRLSARQRARADAARAAFAEAWVTARRAKWRAWAE